jgi:hypothetical protein
MSLPLLKKTGQEYPSLLAASYMKSLDLAELVTKTDGYCEQLTLELPTNPKCPALIKTKTGR